MSGLMISADFGSSPKHLLDSRLRIDATQFCHCCHCTPPLTILGSVLPSSVTGLIFWHWSLS
jgi:hypothetical protein